MEVKGTTDRNGEKRVKVVSVAEGGPCKEGGVQPGDVISQFSGITIVDKPHFRSLAKSVVAGETVPIEVMRNNRKKILTVVAGSQMVAPSYTVAPSYSVAPSYTMAPSYSSLGTSLARRPYYGTEYAPATIVSPRYASVVRSPERVYAPTTRYSGYGASYVHDAALASYDPYGGYW
eukprot:NODE_3233_length_1253_cov_167.700885_g3069_i0.p1 GENE.NODE_3233_length_1253_cov_167.700885_g3069_i0~~NODE_3233_length_1253_cov_167.700885_g3069_i0.p1  ORF type:complete len:176 (-),score=24.57 NODE_3233_length_1253_cov_167.700885_g3069_i0:228-755(-)